MNRDGSTEISWLLNLRSEVRPQKMIIARLVKSFPSHYKTLRFISAFTAVCHSTLSEPDESSSQPNILFL
jgi:hypothetical protein